MLRKLAKFICCKILFRVKYINSNLETNIDKCVVCANHISGWDPIFLYADSKNLSVMAKAELFKFKPFGFILKKIGVFPINRGEKDVKSIMHSVNLLKDGTSNKLLIFPEGTRIKDGKRVPGKIGAAYIALKAEVPILPTKIIWKDKKRRLFSKIYVVYGNPISLDIEKSKDKDYLKKVTNEILDTIYNLDVPGKIGATKKEKVKKEKIRIEKN